MGRPPRKIRTPENPLSVPPHTIFFEKKVIFGSGRVNIVTHKGEIAFLLDDFFEVVLKDVATQLGFDLQSEKLALNRQYGTLRNILHKVRKDLAKNSRLQKSGFLWNEGFYVKQSLIQTLLQNFLSELSNVGRTGIQTEDLFVPVEKNKQILGPTGRVEISQQILEKVKKSLKSLMGSFSEVVVSELESERRSKIR